MPSEEPDRRQIAFGNADSTGTHQARAIPRTYTSDVAKAICATSPPKSRDNGAVAPATARTITLPKNALQQHDGHDIVLIVQNGRAERRAVTIGSTLNDEVTVTSGVAAGERVIIDPPPGLADGGAVSP